MKRAIPILVLALAATVYAVMLAWSLPHLVAIARDGGLADARLFDLRPGGYGFEDARQLLIALGEPGRAFYTGVQHRLDAAFAVLNGLSMLIGLTFVARRLGLAGRAATASAIVLGLAVAGFDLAENIAVAGLLDAGPEAITPAMVAAASRFSVLKSTAVTGALTLLLAGFAVAAYRLVRDRWRRGQP
ncbi:MAG: hypothetical protein WAT70_12770 [Rhizobiaceae bacterium]